MKAHTSNLKTALKTFPLQVDEKITYGNTTLTNDELVEVAPHYEGNLVKSLLKCLDIEATEDIPKDTIINYQKGILVNDNYEYLNYGDYVVVSSEKNEDSNTFLIKCYDKLIYSAVDYVTPTGVVYPISVGDYLEAICNYLGLVLKTKNFKNADKIIPAELYENLGYKFRDVLDEISQCTGGSICLDLNNQVEVKTPIETSDTIDEDLILDINAKFGEKYGPINSIVLSRSGESDNIYLKDDESIAQYGLCELKIVDNQIMNDNNRNEFLQGIADNLFGLEFYTNDFTSQGIFYYDFLDIYNITIDNNTYKCIMLNDDVSVTNGTENIFTNIPDVSQTDYSKADTTDKRINQAYIIVNKMKGEIDAKVDKDGIIAQLNLAVEEGQGVIKAKGNTFILDANNARIDEYGNAEFNNTTIRGGNLFLTDDGENASIKISEINTAGKTKLLYGVEVADKKILFECKNMTYTQLNNFVGGPASGRFLFKVRWMTRPDDKTYYFNISLNPVENSNKELWLEVYDENLLYIDRIIYYFNDNDIMEDNLIIEVPSDAGQVDSILTEAEDYLFLLGVAPERLTEYKGTGLSGEIYYNQDYTQSDLTRLSDIVEETITPTTEDYDKFDFDNNGILDYNDLDILSNIIYDGINSITPAKFEVNYNTLVDNIVVKNPRGVNIFSFGYVKGFKISKNVDIYGDLRIVGTNVFDWFAQKPVVLFDYPNGSADDSNTLSDYPYKYEYIEILYINNDGVENSTKVYTKNRRTDIHVCLNSCTINSTYVWVQYGDFILRNDKILRNGEKLTRISSGAIDYSNNTNNAILIKKILGYK